MIRGYNYLNDVNTMGKENFSGQYRAVQKKNGVEKTRSEHVK